MIIYDRELKSLKNNIKDYIKAGLFKNNIKYECPYCKSQRIIKHGKYHGIQRYLCKNEGCKKTFSNTTGSVWYKSKKSPLEWINYIEIMFEKKTLKECAKELNINIATAFYWRHKILNSLTNIQGNSILEDFVYMRKMLFKENFKGERKIKKIERDNIYFIVASDSKEKIIGECIYRNSWDNERLKREVFSKIHNKSKFYMPTDRLLHNEMRISGKELVYPNENDKNFLNKYYLEVRMTLKQFYGVATKYLKGYLYWISLFFIGEKINNISVFNKLFEVDGYIQCKKIKQSIIEV